MSWRSPTTPLPVEVNPRTVFERLFGDGESTDPAARLAMLKEQRSILDYVSGSIDRLETKIGKSDRNKLTEYLDSIRDIERRIQKAEQQSASMKIPTMERPASAPEAFEDHARLMMDLQVIAFQTDMTRVISFMLGRAGSNRPYRQIGISDGHHSITHHQNDPVKIANVAKIDAYLVQTFAYFLEKLKATPDGDGNLLDHSLILYGSGLGDANSPHAPRTADRRARRRRRPAQGRTPSEVRQGHAAQQSAGQHARHGRRAHRKVRRRHRRARAPHGSLRHACAFDCGGDRSAARHRASLPRPPILRLVEALKRRDRKAVTSLLAQHADVNAAQPDGATALSWATYLDDRESAELLLAAGREGRRRR